MSQGSISQLSVRMLSLDDLVSEVWQGRVRIPELQRPLRWQWEDVRRLFDSIVKGYPIGNLLLWQRPTERVHLKLGALELDAPERVDAWWVVDGQQRLTSLANALDDRGARDERFSLAYDFRENVFRRPAKDDDGYVVPLPVLFDLSRLLRWFADHPDAKDKLNEASEITKAIRQFSVPACIVVQKDEAVLRDIFDRMNNYGKRLSRAEVFAALHPRQEKSKGASTASFEAIVDKVNNELDFGWLDEDTVLRAMLARRGGDVTREIRNEFSQGASHRRDFPNETPEAAYTEGADAIMRAVAFLQEDVGVPHFSFLPYRYLLVALTRFFAHFPEPSARNRTLLRRWFWRAAMLGPEVFNGNWTQAMTSLASRIESGDENGSVQRLLSAPMDRKLPEPRLKQFRTNVAGTRVVVCALWSLHPRSLVTGERFDRLDLVERLGPSSTPADVVGRILRHEPASQLGWAANRILTMEPVPTPSAYELITVPQTTMPAGMRKEALASHAMDDKLVSMLARGEDSDFLNGRQQRIEAVVASFVSRMAESEFEDTPPLDALDFDDPGERDDAGA